MPTPIAFDTGVQLAALENIRVALLAASLPSRSSIEQLGDTFLGRLRDVLNFEIGGLYLKSRRGTLDRITSTYNDQLPRPETISYEDGDQTLNSLLSSSAIEHRSDAIIYATVCQNCRDLIGGDFVFERVALRGSSQVFGMVELACKTADSAHERRGSMSGAQCLTIAASYLSGAITTFRSRNETIVLSALSRFLSDPEVEVAADDLGTVLSRGLQLTIDGLLDYRAAVLRLATGENVLEVFAKAGDSDITWTGWVDHVVRGAGALSGEVLLEKDRIISVGDIASQRQRFVNFAWASENQLRSCISCPLVARGQTMGTVTFYTGFLYNFSELDEALLWSFAARFGAYWDRCQVLAQKERAEEELEEIRYDHHNRLLDSARQAAVRAAESQLTGLLHESKNTFTSAILLLHDARESASGERMRLIERCLGVLETGEQRLDGPRLMDAESEAATDVNDCIRNLVTQRNQWRRERRTSVEFELDLQDLPLINISEEDVIEMVENLLSNAIRSIRVASRKKGQVRISTRRVQQQGDSELEIAIQDNGTGIRKDLQDEIFEKGFTTFTNRGGTGLGLYLVRSIVGRYRGRIRVESQYGSWARFTIRIPVGQARA